MPGRSPLWMGLLLGATAAITTAGLGRAAAVRAPASRVFRGAPLTVRVTTNFEPTPGVMVRVRSKGQTHRRLVAFTDERGLVRFDSVDRAAEVVEALVTGCRPTSTEIQGFTKRNGVLELALESGTPIDGVVLDGTTPRPLEGATVLLRIQGRTFELPSPGGFFVVPGLGPGTHAEVVARAPGRVTAKLGIHPIHPAGMDPELFLFPDRVIQGVVVGADGSGIPDADVSVLPGIEVDIPASNFGLGAPPPPPSIGGEERPTTDGRPFDDSLDRFEREEDDVVPAPEDPDAPRTTTDSSGAFRLDGVPRGGVRLRVRAAGRMPAEIPVEAGNEPPPPMRVVLRSEARVRLRVTAPPGARCPGDARVRLFAGERGSVPPSSAPARGEFLFLEVPPGPVAVFVGATGYRHAAARGTAAEGAELSLDLALEDAGPISGRVVDPEGRAVPRARVDLVSGRHGWVWRNVNADDEGRFDFPSPPQDAYDVVAERSDPNEWTLRTRSPVRVRAPARDLRVQTESVGGLRLRLLDPERRPSVGPAFGVLRRVSAGATRFAPTRLESHLGVMRAGDLADGEYELTVVVLGWVQERRTVRILDGRPVDLGDLAADTGTTLTGRIVDDEDRPVGDGWVVQDLPTKDAVRNVANPSESEVRAVPDEEGRFRFGYFPRGRPVRVRAGAPGLATQRRDVVADDGPVEFRLAKRATLKGTIAASRRGDGERVTLRRAADADGDEEEVPLRREPMGDFRASLDPGTWAAVFTDAGGTTTVLGSWRLGAGDVADVTLRIPER